MTNEKSKLLQAVRRVRDEIHRAIKEELLDDSRTYKSIADANCISVATVQRISSSLGLSRQVGPRPQGRSNGQEVKNGNE
jgi:hypothetical protein